MPREACHRPRALRQTRRCSLGRIHQRLLKQRGGNANARIIEAGFTKPCDRRGSSISAAILSMGCRSHEPLAFPAAKARRLGAPARELYQIIRDAKHWLRVDHRTAIDQTEWLCGTARAIPSAKDNPSPWMKGW